MAPNTPGTSSGEAMATDEVLNTIVVRGTDSDEESSDALSIIDDSSSLDDAEVDVQAENGAPDEDHKSDDHEKVPGSAAEDGIKHVSDSQKSPTPTTANPDPSMHLQPLIGEVHQSIDTLSNPSDSSETSHSTLASQDPPVSPPAEAPAAAPEKLTPIPVLDHASHLTPSLPLEVQPGNEASASVASRDSGSPVAGAGVDIQKLLADMTNGQALPPPPGLPSKPSSSKPSTPVVETTPGSSLPPKPMLSQDARSQPRIETFHMQSGTPTLNIPSQPRGASAPTISSPSNGISSPPGIGSEGISSIASRPSFYPLPAPGVLPTPSQSNPSSQSTHSFPLHNHPPYGKQSYFEFLEEERRHTTEARWEKFPEGSRLFVGNISQERVQKRDVFDPFSRFGRIAQISLKSAFGFVQYYNASDALEAMEKMQDTEIRGRRINLEISKTQKRDGKDREHSPDRRARAGRPTDRYEGRESNRRGRDDYRPGGRDSPPRRDDRGYRPEHNRRDSRNMDSYNSSRNRSRSPRSRYSNDYRQRSPSPDRYGRNRPAGSRHDAPHHPQNAADVQVVIAEPNLSPDFIQWVLKAFTDRGLTNNVMTIDPRRGETRDGVTQRQVKAGAHAIVDLDHRAQGLSKIRIQVFDRSGGGSDIRFDRYDDLEPHIAADVVQRAKGTTQQQPTPQAAPQGYYGQPYGGAQQHQQSQAQYQQTQYSQQPQYQQPPHQQPQYHQQPPTPTQPAPASGLDLSSLIGQIDNATLQKVLAALPGAHTNGGPASAPPAAHAAYSQAPAASTPAPVDIQAILGQLHTPTPPAAHQAHSYAAAYPPPATNPISPVGAGPSAAPVMPSADQNAQVQNIMAQLAMYRK